MRRTILLLPTCLAIAAISGCGNKGPLYYPHPAPAPATPSTAAAPAASSSVSSKPTSGN